MRSLLVFVLFMYIKDSKPFRSDYNFHFETNGWLKLHQIPATFHDAWLRCHLEGAELASPSNAIIESAMWKEIINRPEIMGGVLTGTHATFSKGDYFSVNGSSLSDVQLKWMRNEPDNKNNDEDCILYNAKRTISDIKCSETYPYICYKGYSPNMVVNECGTVDKEYSLDKQTGKCYKFHTVARNWTRAFMTCLAEGGHLAIINSQNEADILKKLFDNNISKAMKHAHPTTMKDFIHIGILEWTEIGVWTTIHGTSLAEAGFDVWASGEPNNALTGEHCGSLHNNGKLNDISCNQLLHFICEKSPESFENDIKDIMIR